MPLSTADVVAALVVTCLAAMAQGVVGIGFAVVSVPILSLVNPALAPVPQLLVVMPLTLAMGLRERRHADMRGALWLLIGRAPGAAIGLALLLVATQRTLDISIAALVLSGVAIRALKITVVRNPGTELLVGTFAGVSSMVASMGGPPMALLYQDQDAPMIRASLGFVFSVGLIVTITVRSVSGLITGDDVRIAVMLLPALLVGYGLSVLLSDRVGKTFVSNGILLVSTAAAAGLIIKAL